MSHPIKVCLLVDTVDRDCGTEKLVPALAKALDRKKIQPHLCCFEDSAQLAEAAAEMPTLVLPFERVYSPAGLRQAVRFRRYVQRTRIDVVHSFMAKSDIFNVLSTFGAGVPAVVTSRLNSGYWYTPKYIRIFRFLNRFTTRVLINSEYAKKAVAAAEKLDPKQTTVFYPGVDLARYSRESGNPAAAASLGIPEGSKVVGIVAHYREVKDLPLFLRAAQLVAAEVPDSSFLLVGNGELQPVLESLAAELGIDGRVFFTAGCGAVADYLARMSVACLSSRSEGLPNAIMEYMAAALPVVATDVGGNSELIVDGSTGFIVRERTPKGFAEPIIRLLRSEQLRTEMGRKGLERASAEFDRSVAVRRLEDFYIDLVQGQDPDSRTRPPSTEPTDRKKASVAAS